MVVFMGGHHYIFELTYGFSLSLSGAACALLEQSVGLRVCEIFQLCV